MSKFEDLTGRRFGRLTVISRARNDCTNSIQWACECACGRKAVVKAGNLKSGHTGSCGCLKRANAASMNHAPNMLGHRFGRLTVIGQEPSAPSGHAIWRCRCDCGKETVAQGGHLRNGDTVSCGCAKAKNYRGRGRRGFKGSAKGLFADEFAVSLDDLEEISG